MRAQPVAYREAGLDDLQRAGFATEFGTLTLHSARRGAGDPLLSRSGGQS